MLSTILAVSAAVGLDDRRHDRDFRAVGQPLVFASRAKSDEKPRLSEREVPMHHIMAQPTLWPMFSLLIVVAIFVLVVMMIWSAVCICSVPCFTISVPWRW